MDETVKKEEGNQEEIVKVEDVEASAGEAIEGAGEEAQEEPKEDRGRNSILWLLGGIYLVYTAYNLIKGYVTGAEGSSLLFMLIGIFFGVTGVILAYLGYKEMSARQGNGGGGLLSSALAKKEEEPKEEKRRLSLAERASLAKSLGDAEEGGEEEQNG